MVGSLRFIDPCAPRPYAGLREMVGLGGTEATLIRIAQRLAPERPVTVEQAARQGAQDAGGIRFLPMDLTRASPYGETIIVVNSWKIALICRKRNPQARICVWQHVIPGKHHRNRAASLANAEIEVICVSRTHAEMVGSFLGGQVKVSAIANPIDDDLHPDCTARDPDLLFFASSPHKGLAEVAAALVTLRRTIPSLRLEVADPGYLAWDSGQMPAGVVTLGTLTRDEVIGRMRHALCLFYPQTRFAETFGLVIAEANAVGCPALVHRGLGANNEVTSDASQCIDAQDPQQIAARIAAWREASPTVNLRPEFRLSAVLDAWRAHIAQSDGPRQNTGYRAATQAQPQYENRAS